MSKKSIALLVLAVIVVIVAVWFVRSRTDGVAGAKNYIGNSVEECSRIQVLCVEGFKRFDDEAGCGCQETERKSVY